jgi:hypothetical protein
MNRNGAASIMLVFSVLALTIFAVVSFVPALREEALMERELARVTAFYEADARAEEILSLILSGANVPGEIDGVYIDFYWDWDLLAEIISFAYPINDTLDLFVAIAIDIDYNYQILEWRVRHIDDWDADTGMNIWEGFGW